MRARRIAAALACAAALVLVAVLAGQLSGGSSAGGPGRAGDGPAAKGGRRGDGEAGGRTPAGRPRRDAAERRLAVRLRRGVERAAALGGEVEAAAMLDRSPAPIVVSSEPGGRRRLMRMWSISKVATMVALLRLLGWGEKAGRPPSAEVSKALEGALARSENCRQRRVVLELQGLAGGTAAARRKLGAVFATVGGRIEPGAQVAAPEPLCVPFLEQQREIADPLAPALLLGTSRWRIGDAARLAHGLAIGAYGEALSSRVVEMMRLRKRENRETEPGELTAPLEWGAGVAFTGLLPAYKAGWGGVLNGNFMAGQIAVVPLGGGDHLALAVMFHPDQQPPRDDPGITAAPAAVEAVMEAAGKVGAAGGYG